MRLLIYIITGFAIIAIVCLGGLALYAIRKKDDEKNQDKTAAARAARWPKNETPNASPGQNDLTFEPIKTA